MFLKTTCIVFLMMTLTGCAMFPPGNVDMPAGTPTPAWTATTTPTLPTKAPGVMVTPTAEPTATATIPPTEAPAVPLDPTLVPTATPVPEPRYAIQPGTPLGVANFAYPEAGCNWMGVGGQAFDINGNPVTALVIEVGGEVGGVSISQYVLSGAATSFGPGGYGVQLANNPVASDGTLWVQLFDISARPLTDRFFFTTYPDCERNLILINFAEVLVHLQPRVFLPSILRSPPDSANP